MKILFFKPRRKAISKQRDKKETKTKFDKADLKALVEMKRKKRETVIHKNIMEETIYAKELVDFVHYEDMFMCSVCGEIYGNWRYEPEIKVIYPHENMMDTYNQKCSCKGTQDRQKWPRFDFDEILTLCYCCGQELLMSGSKWSVWFCDYCKERVVQFNTIFQRTIIPIGRHSIMHGYLLTGKDCIDSEKIKDFAAKVNQLNIHIAHLHEWKKFMILKNLEVVGFSEDVSVIKYLIRAKQLKKEISFEQMCNFFDLPPVNVPPVK